MNRVRKYIFDTNSLLPNSSIDKEFHFISEALRFFGEIGSETSKRYSEIPFNKEIFEITKEITRKYAVNAKLISLNDNEGSADPFIIATAKYMKENAKVTIFDKDEWAIVTDEIKIKTVCILEGIDCLTRKEFVDEQRHMAKIK